MSLRFSVLVLVVELFLSSSALTPEECQPLVTPLSLADASMMLGRSNLIIGYNDHQVYKSILKMTETGWLNFTASPSKPNELLMSQENRINGTCLSATTNIIIDGNTAKASFANMTSESHVLPSCDGCLVLSMTGYARNINKILNLINMSSGEEEITARALYLLARETKVKDSDLEHFKQQASCLGFSGEPDFHYDPKKEFCREGEGFKMSFS
uniref:Apolipoprotein M n=3 Tax=Anabas testudineus TaxID=64144 RepID=A0A3Q1IIX9_ANATE